MWGVGEGNDLDTAKRSALKDVAAKLRVAISAQIESRVMVRSGSTDRYSSSHVAEQVSRTEFRNYVVDKTAQGGQGVYVLVKVDRQAFITDAEQKLSVAEKEVARLMQHTGPQNSIDKFVAQQKALPWIEKEIVAAQMLAGADAGFDVDRLRRYEDARVVAKTASEKVVFELKAKDADKDIVRRLGDYLSKYSIRVGKGGTPLLIDTVANQSEVFGSDTVQLRVHMQVLDGLGHGIASSEFVAHGSSMQDHRAARQAALADLEEQLDEAGLLATLGFKIE